ncbi:hypothetical protein KM043_001486 [Ampulex compressa]|nr:hypothetical protein KM043_001486 [Ampulex compressa]
MSSSKKPEILDISNKQLEVLQWKNARRKQLRELFLKHTGHPTKSALFFDEGMMRYSAMKLTHDLRFQGTVTNFFTSFAGVVTAITLLTIFLNKSDEHKEYKLRTGQVSYADRDPKFI